MSARNGPPGGAVATASRQPTNPAATSKFTKKTPTSGPSKQLPTTTATPGGSVTKHQTVSSSSSVLLPPSAPEGTGTKLTRRESSKSKAGDRKSGLFGWIRHHIGDTVGESGSSTSRGTKKKLETAASFARNNHLSDSMPSLVIAASAGPQSLPSSNTTSRSACGPAADKTRTLNSGKTTGGDVNYRPKKTPVVITTSDDTCGGARSSQSLRNISGRNRWSSYEVAGMAGFGLPLVTVEDSDESTAGDEDSVDTSMTTGQHHLAPDGASAAHRTRSVEALYATATGMEFMSLQPHQRTTHDASGSNGHLPSSATGPTSLIAPAPSSTSISSRDGSPAPAVTTNGLPRKDDTPMELMRRLDERIEEARGVKKQLIAQVLNIPTKDFDSIAEIAVVTSERSSNTDGDRRELLLATLMEADRLTSCISAILRLTDENQTAGSLNDSAEHKSSNLDDSVSTHRSQHDAPVQLFVDVVACLQRQLTMFKRTIEAEHVETTVVSGSLCVETQQKPLQQTLVEVPPPAMQFDVYTTSPTFYCEQPPTLTSVNNVDDDNEKPNECQTSDEPEQLYPPDPDGSNLPSMTDSEATSVAIDDDEHQSQHSDNESAVIDDAIQSPAAETC